MDNLALFCKTYKDDFCRFEILKQSIDKYNADKIPFFIVCPEDDRELFSGLINRNEGYKIEIISDETVFAANNIENPIQDWTSQQIIKLGFYKLNLCNFYSIIDSDCYFIQNFYISDFMYDENTPYFYLYEQIINEGDRDFVKNKLKRKGKIYSFIYNTQVFSSKVLNDFEINYLEKNSLNIKDVIDMCPYEFQWYGEWFLHCKLHDLHPTLGKVKVYWLQQIYEDDKKKGYREKDLIKEGYFAILLNNGWCKDSVFKPSFFAKIYRAKRKISARYNQRMNLQKKIRSVLKFPFIIIKEFIDA